MPHFVIDCSANVVASTPVEIILKEVYYTAAATGLFELRDIKVRLRPFEYFDVGNERKDFIHVFAHIMEGRTPELKADLSQRVVAKLKGVCPNVSVIAMNVYEFEKATYCNLQKLDESEV